MRYRRHASRRTFGRHTTRWCPYLLLLACGAVSLAPLSRAAASDAKAAGPSLVGRHEVAYRLITGQGEIQFKEALGPPDGRWWVEAYWTFRGPGLSAQQEASLSFWSRVGSVQVGLGATWFQRPSDPWDMWVTAAVPWSRQ